MNSRITGFDLARALAVFGMVLVNFKLVMEAKTGNPILLGLAAMFEGRAAALFVVLAGVGIALLSRRALGSKVARDIDDCRHQIIRRGILLIVIGLLYTPIWPADILHFYGCYFLLASLVFTFNDRRLLLGAGAIVLAFPLMMSIFDYSRGWNWETLDYLDLWTWQGMIRHLLFNGFHPVFPWAAFLILGIWLGRQNLADRMRRRQLFLRFISIWICLELLFKLFNWMEISFQVFELTAEDRDALLSTAAMPPLPQYIVAAGSLAVAIIIACVHCAERFRDAAPVQWLVQTGQLSLSLYVAHVIIGMGTLEELGMLGGQSIGHALLAAALFFLGGVAFSVLWLRKFQTGPLEALFRLIVKRRQA